MEQPTLSKLIITVSTILLSFCLQTGCHPVKPEAGFLQEPDLMKEDDRVPFNSYWEAENTDLRSFKKIYVAPVDTTHLLKMSWWENFSAASKSSEASPQAEAKVLAQMWHDEVVDAFNKKKDDGYTVVDTPDDETLVIELAIVEVVPTKVWLNLLSYVVAGPVDNGLTAMEGRFRAGQNGKLLVEFKDAENGQLDVVSTADLTWYGHSKHTLNFWADKIAEICSSAPDAHISSRSPFTLRPW